MPQDTADIADIGFRRELIAVLPDLQRYARRLAGDPDDVEDLVQETSIRVLANHRSFRPGTSMRAWAFTICRNLHYAKWHKDKRMTEWEPWLDDALETSGGQEASAALSQTYQRMERLPSQQRDALALIAVGGCTYEEAAAIEKCATGTMKSRVSRARTALERMHPRQGRAAQRGFDCLVELCHGLLDRQQIEAGFSPVR